MDLGPTWVMHPHLQILNLISSAKALSANKVTVTGSRDLTGMCLLGDQPTPASLSQEQPQHQVCTFPKTTPVSVTLQASMPLADLPSQKQGLGLGLLGLDKDDSSQDMAGLSGRLLL